MIGVIADDTTGANDIGIMFAKHGWATAVVAHDAPDPLPAADALILDTDSRLDPRETAYAKVHAATQRLRTLGCTWLHKKTCSVFRGNIGAEFDAMMDAARGDFAIVSVAFPKNGRATLRGMHSVHGKPLEVSPFAADPVHPTRESNLISILQKQTRRAVGGIDLETVRAGVASLRAALNQAQKDYAYCIVDAVEQTDLTRLAETAHHWPLHAGSSALAEELPRFWTKPVPRDLFSAGDFDDGVGPLVVSGSLTPQSKAQTAALEAAGAAVTRVDPRSAFDAARRANEVERAVRSALPVICAGRTALVVADQSDTAVRETQELGSVWGLTPLAASKAVSSLLAEIAHRLLENSGGKRIVVAGGDTSGTVCRKFGIRGNWVLHEIVTGVPSGLAIGRPLLLVLKSGSFGAEDFLVAAVDHLQSLGRRAAFSP